MSNVPTAVTNTFTASTKAKSAEVNTNFTDVKNWHSTFTYDLKNGTTYLQTSAKSADYTVLDTDGFRTILMTTGASNRTVTLPTAADNTGRIISIKKVDSGAGTCIVDGEGAETIDGSATYTLFNEEEAVTLHCDGTTWHRTSTYGQNPQSMTDAEATRVGVKPYSSGTTYNGGIAPTITNDNGRTGASVVGSKLMPYQLQDGTWRLKGNVKLVFNAVSTSTESWSINGVTFWSSNANHQAISAAFGAATVDLAQAYAEQNTDNLVFQLTAGVTITGHAFSFDVTLESKPTWAY